MLTPSERQKVLEQLHTLATGDVVRLWRSASGADLDSRAFRAVIVEAYPEIASQYASVSADLATEWYNASAPELAYQGAPAPVAPVEQYAANARYALTVPGEAALSQLSGALQRAVWNGARETIVNNVRMERGSSWARYASATACAFCRVMSSRGAVYSTEGAASSVGAERWDIWRNYKGQRRGGDIGRRGRVRGTQEARSSYHNSCRCIAVEVRPGGAYEPPPYAEQWHQDYIEASRAAAPGAGAGDLKDILSHMRANTSARR